MTITNAEYDKIYELQEHMMHYFSITSTLTVDDIKKYVHCDENYVALDNDWEEYVHFLLWVSITLDEYEKEAIPKNLSEVQTFIKKFFYKNLVIK